MGLTEFHEEGLWLIGRLSEKLMALGMHMGTAESCTGGLASVLCTNVPGSSRWFSGSVATYDNSLKTRLLGVDPALLERYGAVSAQVAEAMAGGALDALGVQAALAVTGIAGPDGGTAEKPVGTVWIATAVLGGAGESGIRTEQPIVRSTLVRFPGDRNDVRFGAAMAALGALEKAVTDLGPRIA